MTFALQERAQRGLLEVLAARFEEGGFFIMMLILIVGIIGLILLVRGIYLVRKRNPKIEKTIILINSLGLFALVLGVFGQLIQLINTLDYLSSFEGTTPRDFADGLKTTMLPTLFGAFIFLFTRFSTILLHWIKPQEKEAKPGFSNKSNSSITSK
ncbi:MotA/TolQ/ExbB proton channel family protein [uncultured Salegentibacter sp.]|uniref:MotA/TolQ/ExbB proton channel family protein n=1 Tax=uncultured Salegentibacter sp. TaxID=259320 RepID=UPI0030D8F8F3|tara:strand:+ start:271 stop:735 length:465 start_codon:yes stop_codon:yes gene_type:complete